MLNYLRRDPISKIQFLALALLAVSHACAEQSILAAPPIPAQSPTLQTNRVETVVLPELIPDPLEPFNRVMWAFNRGLLAAVVRPTAKAYRFIVRRPMRRGISNFGRNLTYPGRLINNLLQAKWAGARDETYRFGCNSVFGFGGFLDVASQLHIPKADADFGQTFGKWGWKPDFYLMLPVLGPSNDRDTVGLAADSAANPLTYLTPYPTVLNSPETFFSPYTYASAVITYNNLADSVEQDCRFAVAERDPYSELQFAWGFARDTDLPDFTLKDRPDQTSLETLQSIFLTFADPKFPDRGTTRFATIPTTGHGLQFTYWLQTGTAPIVYIIPGVGSHRLAGEELALAELVVNHGFSAVCVSNPFNYEFIERASTAAVPGYTPTDASDLNVALTAIDNQLRHAHPGRLGARALMGYSMGAFQALYLAATATPDKPNLSFDRYVAVDTPVRLLYGVSRLDDFFQAPLDWPAESRSRNIENTFIKAAAVLQGPVTPQTNLPPPFSGIESRFLVGTAFRLILRDAIFTSQSRVNLGVLEHRINPLRRVPVYREILGYSFGDYYAKFVTPYYMHRGIDLSEPEALKRATDLQAYSDQLGGHPNVRVIVNQNDFLLAPTDLQWLQTTFAPDRLTVFPHGGHLGNLGEPEVQKAILKALSGLGSLQPGFERE